jgi:isocitrate dehydrogenase kinase/phosphatase
MTAEGLDASGLARCILDGFSAYRRAFAEITAGALARFEHADWSAVQSAGTARLAVHQEQMGSVLEHFCHVPPHSKDVWPAIKSAYVDLIGGIKDVELAETFFNSVHREFTNDGPVDPTQMFLHRSTAERLPPEQPIYRSYHTGNGVVPMVKRILSDCEFGLPWLNLDTDVANVLRSLAETRREITRARDLEVDVVRSIFFRNKGAYLIGRLRVGEQHWPLALPILRTQDGQLYVDTLICDEDELSVMFSFTRAYFMVDVEHPSALVEFLQELLPNKRRSELYASIGLHKHGKTEFYRGFLEHLDQSDDEFIVAEGIKGMVMAVFTLPSFETVFKVIKDEFPPQKNITPAEVKAKYHVVKTHDRAGRMADTQEFENFRFPRDRFSEALIDELNEVCPSALEITQTDVIIKHLYTERRMTPLNLYIERCTEQELESALDEYGNAIQQLAAANIFPGDMLLKNFGVTRHGRVVFYDYDEISYMTDVDFREIPEPQTPEQEMAAEPWYTVGPNDVFPEEFRRFLFGKRRIKQMFTEMHGNLFDAAYWRELQAGIEGGVYPDLFPYRRKKRFIRQRANTRSG